MTETKTLTVETHQPRNATDTAGETLPAAATSRLASLRTKRAETLAALHIDLYVPRYSQPELVVRYGPLDPDLLNAAMERRKKRKTSTPGGSEEWLTLAYADALIDSCRGVYGEMDGQRFSLLSDLNDDPHTCGFDADLGKLIAADDEVPPTRAVDVVKMLYFTKSEIIGALTRLSEWSGVEMPDAEEAFLTS
jgi:hypothetical protein